MAADRAAGFSPRGRRGDRCVRDAPYRAGSRSGRLDRGIAAGFHTLDNTFSDPAGSNQRYSMFQLSNISKSYGPTRALRNTDLAVLAGRTTVLIGPSGCGKSTLLRLMIGLIRPDIGRVLFEGAQIMPSSILELRRRMGYVTQDGGLFPHLTARRNVTLMARHLSWSKQRINTRLSELSELTQFPQGGLDRFPIQLSGGQKQRVSLMRALMLDPDVLLLDEPLAALDPMIRSDLQAELRRIFRKLGKTVIMVTHDLSEAAYFCNVTPAEGEVVLMREGRIVQQGAIDDLVRSPSDPFVTRFINAQQAPRDLSGGLSP